MLPWIQVYSNLADHPKIYALVDRMKLRRNSEAVGIVVSLWLWAAKNAPDGDLSGFPERAIADAVGYSSSYAGKLCQLLVETRWLDEKENGYALHDWVEYAPAIIDMYEKDKNRTRERVRKFRERRRSITPNEIVSQQTCNVTCNVTSDKCNAPRLDKTTEDKRREEHMSSSVASSWSKSKLNSLFSPKLQLSESAQEELLSLTDGMEEGLLLQSLEIARDNGKLNWGYVRGILRNWQKNGVKTLGEFQEREARRRVNKSGGNSSILVPGAQDVAESRRRMEQLREELKEEGT